MANIHSLSDLAKKQGDRKEPPGPPRIGSMGGGTGARVEKNIKYLQKEGELQKELRNAGGKLVVAYFTASWCGPCKQIAPIYAALSDNYTDVVFLKIDVDELQETAQNCGIKAMPTFQFYKNSSKLEEFTGADPGKLKATVEKHRASKEGPSSSAFSTGGHVLGGNKTGSTIPSQPTQPSPVQNISTPQNNLPRHENDIFLSDLLEMGFSKDKAEKALLATGGSSIEAAMDWCFSHPDDEQQGNKLVEANTQETPMDIVEQSKQGAEEGKTVIETEESINAPVIHNAICNGCMEKIIGIRWKCAVCSDYDLCSSCYDRRTHNSLHQFDPHEKDIENPEKRPLTALELEEQKKKLQEKIRQKKEQRAVEEKQAEIEKEKNRIKNGKEAQEAKKLWEQKTRDREDALKKKEKEEAKKAQMAIKHKIEQDKLEREAAKKKAQGSGQAPEKTLVEPAKTQIEPSKREYSETLIQIRFKDGNTIKATFKPNDPIRTVHGHVALLLGNDNFSISTTFPRRVFGPRDPSLDTTLIQAELVPTGTFIVQ